MPGSHERSSMLLWYILTASACARRGVWRQARGREVAWSKVRSNGGWIACRLMCSCAGIAQTRGAPRWSVKRPSILLWLVEDHPACLNASALGRGICMLACPSTIAIVGDSGSRTVSVLCRATILTARNSYLSTTTAT